MEYFPYGDLGSCLDGPVPELEAQTIARQLLEGLKLVHNYGITHRDLKPQNVFVVQKSPDWWIKIGDFGISKRIGENTTSLHTEIGTVN
jgi:serine/threonine protein kinase